MANKHNNLSELFTAIANAIRTADDSIVGPLVADDFPDIISNIESGIDTTLDASEAASATDIVAGKKAYVNGILIEGLLEPDPNDIKTGVTIAGVAGTFTQVSANAAAAANLESGKIAFVNGSQITGTLPLNTTLTFSSATNNSTNSNIAIKGRHSVKFIGDANTDITTTVPYSNIVSAIGLTAAQIKSGESVLGLTGTFSNEASNPAEAAHIQSGKVAFVNGTKITGTLAPAANTIKYGTTIAGVAGSLLSTTTTATAANIMSGKTAYNSSGTLLTGTAFGTTTTATAARILSGYTAYTNTGTLLTGTATSLQVATGSVSDSSNVYTISTSFTPKGFAMFTTAVWDDMDYEPVCIYSFTGSTSATMVYEDSTEVNAMTKIGSALFHSYYFTYGSDFGNNETDVDLVAMGEELAYAADVYASYLDYGLAYSASTYTDDSTLYAYDVMTTGNSYYLDAAMYYNTAEASTTVTASYSSTGVSVTVPSTHWCSSMQYVVWG